MVPCAQAESVDRREAFWVNGPWRTRTVGHLTLQLKEWLASFIMEVEAWVGWHLENLKRRWTWFWDQGGGRASGGANMQSQGDREGGHVRQAKGESSRSDHRARRCQELWEQDPSHGWPSWSSWGALWGPGAHCARLKTVQGEADDLVVLRRWDGKIELKVFKIEKDFYAEE